MTKQLFARIVSIAIALVYIAVATPSGSALSANQQRVFGLGIANYDTEIHTKTCAVSVATNLSGSDNQEKAFNYLVSKGLSNAQAAGVVGNLMQESQVNPNSGSNGGSTIGIAQWEGARDDALKALAQQQGKPYTDLGVQLDYLWKELNEGYARVLEKLKASTTVPEATNIFVGPDKYPSGEPAAPTDEVRRQGGFENPGRPNMANRLRYAADVMQRYGGGDSGTSTDATTASAPTGGCGEVSGPGESTQFVDGFTVYSQYDPQWKNNAYGSSTIGASGCGPSAMAMIITALTGQQVTPAQTVAFANTKGIYVPGAGSSWTIAPVLAEHWNLKAENIGANVSKITAALQAGSLVIGSGNGPKPFTSGGHYIVIRAVTANGKWKVGDSAHSDTSAKDWDPQEIIASMAGKDGSVYAISK